MSPSVRNIWWMIILCSAWTWIKLLSAICRVDYSSPGCCCCCFVLKSSLLIDPDLSSSLFSFHSYFLVRILSPSTSSGGTSVRRFLVV